MELFQMDPHFLGPQNTKQNLVREELVFPPRPHSWWPDSAILLSQRGAHSSDARSHNWGRKKTSAGWKIKWKRERVKSHRLAGLKVKTTALKGTFVLFAEFLMPRPCSKVFPSSPKIQRKGLDKAQQCKWPALDMLPYFSQLSLFRFLFWAFESLLLLLWKWAEHRTRKHRPPPPHQILFYPILRVITNNKITSLGNYPMSISNTAVIRQGRFWNTWPKRKREAQF